MSSPYDWFWVVGGDESRAWSGAAEAYVSTFLPEKTTHVDSEITLRAMLEPYGIFPPIPLSVMQASYQRKIDADAEAVRLRFITPGSGMALTYQEKLSQAQAVLTLGEDAANALTPTERDTQYPVLAASVGIEAETLYACAQLVVSKYEAFSRVSLLIERARLGGKSAVAAAGDKAGVLAAYTAIVWPTA